MDGTTVPSLLVVVVVAAVFVRFIADPLRLWVVRCRVRFLLSRASWWWFGAFCVQHHHRLAEREPSPVIVILRRAATVASLPRCTAPAGGLWASVASVLCVRARSLHGDGPRRVHVGLCGCVLVGFARCYRYGSCLGRYRRVTY